MRVTTIICAKGFIINVIACSPKYNSPLSKPPSTSDQNTSDGTGPYDGTNDGIFGRKVIYRDLSTALKAVKQSG